MSQTDSRTPMRNRDRDKAEVALSASTRVTAISLIDSWADLAERKDAEASAAYLLVNERTAQLRAMTEARDLCKRQAAEAAANWTGLRAWLRDEHPDVYAAIPEGM